MICIHDKKTTKVNFDNNDFGIKENICSVFSKISGITEGISQIRGMSIISESGQVDKNKVMQLMLKNPAYLTKEEKEILEYAKIVLSYINASNINLKNAFKENNLTKRENSFVSLKSMATSSRGYIGLQHMWWGDQIYLSHQAVTDLNDFLMGAGIASGIAAFLAKNGIKLAAGYVSSIALFATPVAWAMSKVDNGNGVYLNCILYVPCTITPA